MHQVEAKTKKSLFEANTGLFSLSKIRICIPDLVIII